MRKAPHAFHAPHPEMTLKSAAACVKATSQSSTARPQEKNFLKFVMPGLDPGIHVLMAQR
jgi:hypothetical protein